MLRAMVAAGYRDKVLAVKLATQFAARCCGGEEGEVPPAAHECFAVLRACVRQEVRAGDVDVGPVVEVLGQDKKVGWDGGR